MNVVTAATDVKREVATATGESTGRMQQSLDLLSRMTASFATDHAVPRITTDPHFPRLVQRKSCRWLNSIFAGSPPETNRNQPRLRYRCHV